VDSNRVASALLVDDDPGSQQANLQRLENEGYSVVLVRDESDALARAKQLLPSAIFVHLVMRSGGNVAFMQALRADDSCRHIRVVVLPRQAPAEPAKRPLRAVPRDGW
jgi:CheY-like chemotaxis protein